MDPHRRLESVGYAEIGGLVVAATHRRQGIGRALADAAGQWARSMGHGRVRVRTNVIRQEAAAFYGSLGFDLRKQQKVFERAG